MTTGTFLVLQNAQPGRDQDHADWYLSDHLADVGQVPGMVRGTYATAAEGGGTPAWLHLGYYLIDGEPGRVFEEVLRRSFSGAWKLANTLDFRGMMRSIGVQRSGFARHGVQQAVGDFVLVLLLNPQETNTAALLEWSRGPAFVDATSLPEVTAARLFELVPHDKIKKAYPYRFALVCDLGFADVAGELEARIANAMGDLIEPDVLRALYIVRGVTPP
ncbi:MAG: hypothetical protein EON93_22950 [Burkholderiales bacterium]|nr:MAG: hypothetical protein EON93_22950 [Burkholderiales bacterium]